MKKILVINTKYKIFGGEESNIVDELKFLNQYYDVEYLEFDNQQRLTFWDFLAFFTNSNLNSNAQLIKSLKDFKPDVVYVHNLWFKANLGVLKVLKRKDIMTLYKVHNFRYYCANSYFKVKHLEENEYCPACNLSFNKKALFNKYYKDSYIRSFLLIKYTKKLIKIFRKDNLKILAISNFHLDFLKRLKVSPKKLNLYLNPIQIPDVKHSLNSSKSNTVVYAGRLSEEKGLTELLDTWKEANTKNLILKIIGTGPIEIKLKRDYDENNIKFLGQISNNLVKDQIMKSRAVITSTKLFEGQPRLLCEASSLGIPSIFPAFGGMSEFFPEDYSFIFKQYDYIDLKRKIEQLHDEKILNLECDRVKTHLKEILSESSQLSTLKEIIKQ